MTAVGLGTAAGAGAAIALAFAKPPSRPRRLNGHGASARIRSFPPSSDPFDQDGSGLFV